MMTPGRHSHPARPCVPCAWGDVLDRLTILRLKVDRFSDAQRLAHVRDELADVAMIGEPACEVPGVKPLVEQLSVVNAALWETEDAVHARARAELFDPTFVALARDVIRLNNARAALKREISLLLGSTLIEEKQYGAE